MSVSCVLGSESLYFGDFLTGGFHRVIASTFNGDLNAIKKVTEDKSLYDFVRVSAIDSLLVLYSNNLISRSCLISYYERIFDIFSEDQAVVVDYVISSCVDIYAHELKDQIVKTFDSNENVGAVISKEEVEKDFSSYTEEESLKKLRDNPYYSLIYDPTEEMKDWHCFAKDKK